MRDGSDEQVRRRRRRRSSSRSGRSGGSGRSNRSGRRTFGLSRQTLRVGGAVLLGIALIAAYAVHRLQRQQQYAQEAQARVDAHPVRVLATALWSEYKANPTAAAANYNGHTLEVTGHLATSMEMMGGQQMLLFATGDGQRTMRAMLRADATPLPSAESKQDSWVRLSCPTLAVTGGEPSLQNCVTAEQAAAE